MRKLLVIGFVAGLAGCQKSVTPEGCPICMLIRKPVLPRIGLRKHGKPEPK